MDLIRLKQIRPTLLSEIALRCSDTKYVDFPKQIYERAILYAERKIAFKYRVLNRYFSFKASGTEEVALTIPSFAGEYRVTVNGVEYETGDKHELEETETEYYLYFDSHAYKFNYTGRSEAEDDVVIYYNSDVNIEDYDLEETTPVLPKRYEEEVIAIAVSYIVKLALAKFTGMKLEKYLRIREEYNSYNEDKVDGRLVPEEKWTKLETFKFI